jgi:hypothetical protein
MLLKDKWRIAESAARFRALEADRTYLMDQYSRLHADYSLTFPMSRVNAEYSHVQDHLSRDNSLLLDRLSVLKNSSLISETDTCLYLKGIDKIQTSFC